MSAKFHAIGNEVQHTNNTGFVYSCQAVQLVDDADTFGFIVGTTHQIGDAVNNDHLNAAILVVKLVHALDNSLQAFLARHACQAVSFEEVGHFVLFAAAKDITNVFVQLYFRLLGIVEQYDFVVGVGIDSRSQCVDRKIGMTNSSGNQASYIITFSRSFATRDAE